MSRTQILILFSKVVLVITFASPVVAFGYINAGFRSQAAYDRYLREGRHRNEANERQKDQEEFRRRQAEKFWREYHQQLGDLNAAVQRDPNDMVAVYQRGKFFQKQNGNERDKAMADFNLVIERDPQFARAYFRRSFLWLWKDDYRRALDDLDEAIRLEPTFAASHFHRATLLVACPKNELRSMSEAHKSAQMAVDVAEQAAKLQTNRESTVRTSINAAQHAEFCALLGAIAAEMGDFKAAIDWETKASTFPHRLKSPRLTLYQNSRSNSEAITQAAGWLHAPIQ